MRAIAGGDQKWLHSGRLPALRIVPVGGEHVLTAEIRVVEDLLSPVSGPTSGPDGRRSSEFRPCSRLSMLHTGMRRDLGAQRRCPVPDHGIRAVVRLLIRPIRSPQAARSCSWMASRRPSAPGCLDQVVAGRPLDRGSCAIKQILSPMPTDISHWVRGESTLAATTEQGSKTAMPSPSTRTVCTLRSKSPVLEVVSLPVGAR